MARKIILKEDGLTETSNTPTGYKFFGDSEGSISEKVGATVSVIGGSVEVQSLRYKAIISQTSIFQTSGLLVIGEEYVIRLLEAGDDFTNVGYVSEGVAFIATGTTPTNWSNRSSVLFLTQSQPVINNEIFNTIPNLTVSFGNDGSGNYKILFQTTGLFLANKTFFTQINLQRISDNLLTYDSGSFMSIEFEIYP